MKFAGYVFLIAGVYGVLVIAPQYFLEEQVGAEYPPRVTHREFYYGFARPNGRRGGVARPIHQ